jgi:pyruvate/2-oxoacid:ferredoxin oxidoreductase beta subunit
VTFNHTKHIFMSQGCGTCHHQHGSNASSCKGCHSVSSSIFKKSVVNTFMACRTCHTIYDPANPNMPGLKVAYHRTCFQCHKGMNGVGTDPKGCTETCHAKQKMKARK